MCAAPISCQACILLILKKKSLVRGLGPERLLHASRKRERTHTYGELNSQPTRTELHTWESENVHGKGEGVSRVANRMVLGRNHLDPESDPFLNNGSDSGSDFDLKFILLAPDPDLVLKPNPPKGQKFNSKIGCNLSSF